MKLERLKIKLTEEQTQRACESMSQVIKLSLWNLQAFRPDLVFVCLSKQDFAKIEHALFDKPELLKAFLKTTTF